MRACVVRGCGWIWLGLRRVAAKEPPVCLQLIKAQLASLHSRRLGGAAKFCSNLGTDHSHSIVILLLTDGIVTV